MKRKNHLERGQALIIIAFGLVALIGLTALSIDGGNAYSDRRHAQNAADTAALAGALANVRGDPNWQNAALVRAASNGYNNDGTTNTVSVYLCSNPNSSCGVYAGNSQYLQVLITSHVKTYFAQVIGIPEVVNKVSAIAQSVPGKNAPMFGGNAIVSLNKSACSAVNYQGSASVTLNGSGIFDNSNCTSGTNGAFNTNTGSGTLQAPCLTVVGSITTGTNSNLNVPSSCLNSNQLSSQLSDPLSLFEVPNITCGSQTAQKYQDSAGAWHISPGNYTGAFPPSQVTIMDPGTYCINAGNQGFTLTGGQVLNGNNVLIYMLSGNVSWSSGGVNLSAPGAGSGTYQGLLLYMDPSNCSQITINGNGTSTFTGSILAPCSNVKLTGGAGGAGYNNQIIADTVTLSGNNNIVINYKADQNWQPPQSPVIRLAK
jgi:Flp pilus assembly protein TadG